MMLATGAKLLAAPPVERSVVLMAPTAEEYGLLGSEYYARQPCRISDKPTKVIAAFAYDVGETMHSTAHQPG